MEEANQEAIVQANRICGVQRFPCRLVVTVDKLEIFYHNSAYISGVNPMVIPLIVVLHFEVDPARPMGTILRVRLRDSGLETPLLWFELSKPGDLNTFFTQLQHQFGMLLHWVAYTYNGGESIEGNYLITHLNEEDLRGRCIRNQFLFATIRQQYFWSYFMVEGMRDVTPNLISINTYQSLVSQRRVYYVVQAWEPLFAGSRMTPVMPPPGQKHVYPVSSSRGVDQVWLEPRYLRRDLLAGAPADRDGNEPQVYSTTQTRVYKVNTIGDERPMYLRVFHNRFVVAYERNFCTKGQLPLLGIIRFEWLNSGIRVVARTIQRQEVIFRIELDPRWDLWMEMQRLRDPVTNQKVFRLQLVFKRFDNDLTDQELCYSLDHIPADHAQRTATLFPTFSSRLFWSMTFDCGMTRTTPYVSRYRPRNVPLEHESLEPVLPIATRYQPNDAGWETFFQRGQTHPSYEFYPTRETN